ncbi:ATP-binding protein [Streptomyces sp. p1417]|uniref:histidine kinase n=1 Tax=Streptomyces typhae TaxID=2681492 RepID=A0A6L6X8I7_9ACTN|nr:ATP-binding protein [Streptomyces typhae]MVO90223.1 ATP-binding protein [Streptomyces typhae]
MPDSALPAHPATLGHHRRLPSRTNAFTVRCVRLAVVLPLLLLALLLGAAFALWSMSAVAQDWLLAGLLGGLAVVAVVAGRGARTAARAVQTAAEETRAAELTPLTRYATDYAAAVEKSVAWSAEELVRGGRPALPTGQAAQPGTAGEFGEVLGALHFQVIASLIRVHDESQSGVLLEVLRRLAAREHALVGRALEALTQVEGLTDDPELLARIWEIDHLVTRVRRQVESTAVLGGHSLRSTRQPVPVRTVLRGAVSEVVQYARVAVVPGSVGIELGLPGHVGPDLTHLLAELIENSCECSDPSTQVVVRAQRVPLGLEVEVEDRAIRMDPQMRERMNQLLAAPDGVDVSGQVRAGQIGLLVAAKIAQSHGLSVRLQENVAGGTTAQVVIPSQLLVAIDPVADAGVRPTGTLTAPPPSRAASPAPAPRTAEEVVHSGPAGEPGVVKAGQADVPALPTRTRTRRPGAFRPTHEPDQPPAPLASPGLAGAFRTGIQTAGTIDSSPAPVERPGP